MSALPALDLQPEVLTGDDRLQVVPDEGTTLRWISDLTGCPKSLVRRRLQQERARPGTNVARAFGRTGLPRYEWSAGLARFYAETDAFLYELVAWNLNGIKLAMSRWVLDHLAAWRPEPLEILCLGDGLGFDALRLHRAGHRVTFHELPGYGEAFARRLFASHAADIPIVRERGDLANGAFDAVLCLDVLEHVPDPAAEVRDLVGYLRRDGRLVVHAPFYLVHPSNPTHLRANRRFSGDLSLFAQAGLHPVAGEGGWNPISLSREPARVGPGVSSRAALFALRLSGLYLRLGRLGMGPFRWIVPYRRLLGRWFTG